MGSGKGSGGGRRRGAARTVPRAAACALGACLVGGCATIDPEAVLAEREAALARWSSCVDRHAGLGQTPREAIEVTRDGCDGYRRDVAMTFAPHLEPRVRARLDARERHLVVRERVARGAAAGDGPLSAAERLRERLERVLSHAGEGLGDG